MNNIKILEEFRKSIKNFNNYKDNTNVSLINKKQVKALENLIQENKKLKERCKELIKEKQELTTIIEDDCIPKSKVKEKIEELDKEMAKDVVDEFGIHSQEWAELDWIRYFLLKLLKEGE